MTSFDLGPMSEENLRAIAAGRDYLEQVRLRPEIHWPFFRPCDVKV